MAEHGPSEKATHAVARMICHGHYGDWRYDPGKLSHGAFFHEAEDVLAAAHDPALGLDRSVCLREACLLLARQEVQGFDQHTGGAAGFLERAFTESSSPDREG